MMTRSGRQRKPVGAEAPTSHWDTSHMHGVLTAPPRPSTVDTPPKIGARRKRGRNINEQ
nr:MAG TPA: hypothetical protein [Caudoviricetes sp.]